MAYQIQTAPADSFSIGRVFSRAFATITANPGAALGVAFLFGAMPLIGYHYLEHIYSTTTIVLEEGHSSLPPDFWPMLLLSLCLIVLNTALSTVAQGAFAPLVVAQEAGRPVLYADAAAFGLRALLPLVALGLVVGVGITVASIFLLIPGIILSLMWAVAGPVLVAEHCGIHTALARSRVLTEDARVRILALLLVVGGAMLAFNLFADRLAGDYHGSVDGMFGTRVSMSYLLIKAFADTVSTVVLAAVYGALYVELRNWKDGTPVDALAEVFA